MISELNTFQQLVICLTAGFLSFFTPCVLPLIPVFLISISHNINRYLGTLLFSIGLTIGLLSLGFIVSAFDTIMAAYTAPINIIINLSLIFFGIFSLLPQNIPIFSSTYKIDVIDRNISPYLKPILIGFTFGFGWSPCVGPILGGVISLYINTDTILQGMLLLIVYSLGMCLPLFLFCIIGTDACLYNRVKNWTPVISKIGAICLICFGVYNLSYLFH